jgi:hypothetical protein
LEKVEIPPAVAPAEFAPSISAVAASFLGFGVSAALSSRKPWGSYI